jgi:hypothetical protein
MEDESRTETEREREEPKDEDGPWAKFSSGNPDADADKVDDEEKS